MTPEVGRGFARSDNAAKLPKRFRIGDEFEKECLQVFFAAHDWLFGWNEAYKSRAFEGQYGRSLKEALDEKAMMDYFTKLGWQQYMAEENGKKVCKMLMKMPATRGEEARYFTGDRDVMVAGSGGYEYGWPEVLNTDGGWLSALNASLHAKYCWPGGIFKQGKQFAP